MKTRIPTIGLAVLALTGALALAACAGTTGEGAPPSNGATTGEGAPPTTGATPSAGAPIPGGGLSIEEAIASTLEGPLMVKGYVVASQGQTPRLCSTLLESYPPQCGEPSLAIEALDVSTLEGLSQGEDPSVTWSEAEISILGTVENGVLTVDPTSI